MNEDQIVRRDFYCGMFFLFTVLLLAKVSHMLPHSPWMLVASPIIIPLCIDTLAAIFNKFVRRQ